MQDWLQNCSFIQFLLIFSNILKLPEIRESRTEFPVIPAPRKIRISRDFPNPGISQVKPYKIRAIAISTWSGLLE